MFYVKPTLKNLSQGERLAYVRGLRHMTEEDYATYFEYGGDNPKKSIQNYESGRRCPRPKRLKEIAELYEVSQNAIKEYDFKDPVDYVYYQMWLEELYPYYEINLNLNSILNNSEFDKKIYKGLKKWQEMREKRENYEISDEEYLEWKFNFKLDN